MYIQPPDELPDNVSEYLTRQFSTVVNELQRNSKPFYTTALPRNPKDGKLYYFPTTINQYAPGVYVYKKDSNSYEAIVDATTAVSLGTTHDKAFYGDWGLDAYSHSKEVGNPHKTTAADIGLNEVDNTSDKNKPLSNATIAELTKYVLKTTKINAIPLTGDIVLSTANIQPTANRYYVTFNQLQLLKTPADATHDGYLTSTAWKLFDGIVGNFEAAEDILQGQLVYLSLVDNKIHKASAAAYTTAKVIGIVVSNVLTGFTTDVRVGLITLADWTAIAGVSTLSVGSDYFLDTVAGMITTAVPSVINVYVGKALSTTSLDFKLREAILL